MVCCHFCNHGQATPAFRVSRFAFGSYNRLKSVVPGWRYVFPISGVADRIPEKIAHLVYLDSVLAESGRSAFSYYPPAEVEARIKAAEKETNGLAVPVPQQLPAVWGLGKEGDPDYDWVRRRLTPHPLQSYTTALTFKAPVGNNLPRTYIHCTQPSHPVLEDSRKLVRSWTGWKWVDLPAPHDSMITHPDAVVGLVLGA